MDDEGDHQSARHAPFALGSPSPHRHPPSPVASQVSNTDFPPFSQRPRRTAGMPVTLALVLGTFAFAAVLVVLAVGTWTGYRNTIDLIQQKAALVVSSAVSRLTTHLDAAEDQAGFVGRALSDGEISPQDRDHLVTLMQGALAATPQISGLYFLDTNYRLTGAERTETSAVPYFAGLSLDPTSRQMVSDARTHHKAYWGPLLWRDEWNSLQVNLRYPVWRNNTFLGLLIAHVGVPSLSEFMADMNNEFGYNAFILVDHQYVLAHPLLQFGMPSLNRWHPMPTLAQMGDPVLMSIWDPQSRDDRLSSMLAGHNGHAIRLGDTSYVFLYQQVKGYSTRPWLVGTYVRAGDLTTELKRLLNAVYICMGVLVLVLVGAVVLGRRISRPARILAGQARLIKDLNLDAVRPVPGSYFRELNDAAEAFNAMLVGLRWFEAYVPKVLVRRLIAAGLAGGKGSQERVVTVLFTDIRNFTGLASRLSAQETTQFLNHHFSLITDCVLATGGTVDKFIGDSVMAFWGAPEDQDDHADRALQAAEAITTALANDPLTQDYGVTVRMGLHTGMSMVGNIGSAERLNYTLVGQTVIVAHRIEQFGRAFPCADDHPQTVILASLATIKGAGRSLSDPQFEPIGAHQLRGAPAPIDLVRLHL